MLFLQFNWLSSVPSQHCWVTFEFSKLLHSEGLHVLEAVFMPRCNMAVEGEKKAEVTASVVTASCFPLLKDQLGRDGIFHRYPCEERSHLSVNPGVRQTQRNLISFLVSIQVDLPRDLKTVVFSL